MRIFVRGGGEKGDARDDGVPHEESATLTRAFGELIGSRGCAVAHGRARGRVTIDVERLENDDTNRLVSPLREKRRRARARRRDPGFRAVIDYATTDDV